MGEKNKELRKPILITAPIAEITADPAVSVLLKEEDVREMTEGDESPQFPIVAIEEGTSKNKFHYGAGILHSIAEQVNELQPVGYLGHTHREPGHKDNLLPPPQTVWAGAIVEKGENGKSKLLVKGYNLPKAEIRDYIKRKAVNSVSWAGDAVVTPHKDGGYEVKEFILESIDWSRKNVQGMNAKLVAVVSEMENENQGEDRQVTPEEIARLQLAELEEHNEALVNLIRSHAAKEARETAIAEMKEEHANEAPAEEVTQIQDLRTKLGIAEDKSVVDAVVEIYEKVEEASQAEVKLWFESLIAEKIPNEKPRKLVARLVGVSEMKGDFVNDKDKIKQALESRLNDALENDEEVKVAIKEMSGKQGGAYLHNAGNNDEQTSENLREEFSSI